jgi:hypothetical protein
MAGRQRLEVGALVIQTILDLVALAAYFIVRPRLWWPALVVGQRFIPRRFPWVPSRKFIRFRLETMYGDVRVPSGDDLERYVLWAYRFPR